MSVFRKLTIEQAETFSWSECVAELNSKAPILCSLFSHIVSCTDHRNSKKKAEIHYPGICTAVAVLLKERNRYMCGVQTFISLVLFSSRVNKKVS